METALVSESRFEVNSQSLASTADPRNPALYHLVLDATALSVDAAVNLVCTAAEAAWTCRERDLTDRPGGA